MSWSGPEKQLHAAIISYLNSVRSRVPDPESLDVAVGVLGEAFGSPASNAGAQDLLSLFQAANKSTSAGADASAASSSASVEGEHQSCKKIQAIARKVARALVE
jgi:hypothetical protein